jgi:hypothetical protein
MNRSPVRSAFLLATVALACLAVSPQPQAVCQEGCSLTGGNTFLGDDALVNNTIGFSNTASGINALVNNTTGNNNTANGSYALGSNTTGNYNTANGVAALGGNSTGNNNTATGFLALAGNGNNNTADGVYTLMNNTSGFQNTASGSSALNSNTTGNYNTANGQGALYGNLIGYQNTASGVSALANNNGSRNTANGVNALFSNTTGSSNTADGFQALYYNTGSNNVGLGFNAGTNLTTGSGNVCIGYNVLGVAGESNTTRISNVYSSVASGRAVYINADNKIGTLVSSRRFKEEIKPMDKTSEAILELKPVTFHYKKEIERNGGIMFGLIAEDVEKVDPDLVTRNEKGETEAVRYEAVNAMLLNEFLKEHRTVQEQGETITELKKQIAALTAGLQRVSAEVELSKPAPQTVLNNQ